MKVGVIGVGRLGLAIALVFEQHGHDVMASSYKREYVTALRSKQIDTTEPEIKQRLARSNINFTVDNHAVIEHADIIYLMVATPSLADGTYDMQAVWQVVKDIKAHPTSVDNKMLVIACTTNPGVCEKVHQDLLTKGISTVYSPVLVAQGSVIRDFQNPDIVLIGAEEDQSGKIAKEFFASCVKPQTPMHVLSLRSAEIVKMAMNCWSTFKISFANMIGQILAESGQKQEINSALKAIGDSRRCGHVALNYGFGYGGPCLPRDNRSMFKYAESIGIDYDLGVTVDSFNKNHAKWLVEQLIMENPDRLPFYFEYLTYKPRTTIMEESQQYEVCKELLRHGYSVIVNLDEFTDIDTKLEMEKQFPSQIKFTSSIGLPNNYIKVT